MLCNKFFLFSYLQIDALVTAHYDMVLLFAQAITQLQHAGLDYRDGSLLSDVMRNTSYTGLQSGIVRIDAHGDAKLSYEISAVAPGAAEFTVRQANATNHN